MLNKIDQSQKNKYSIIPVIRVPRSQQIQKYRKQRKVIRDERRSIREFLVV